MYKAKIVTIILSFFITIAALYYAFRGIKLNFIFGYILKGEYLYILPAMFCLWFYYYLRALRWGVFFDQKIKKRVLFSATIVGFMASNVFPIRLGEVYKAYIIGRHQNISKSACLATVMLERLWDGFTLVFFSAIVLLMLKTRYVVFAAALFVIFNLAILLILIVWVKNSSLFVTLIGKVLSFFSPKFSKYLIDRLVNFSSGLSIFRDVKRIIIATIFSFFIWLFAALIIYFMLRIFYTSVFWIIPFFAMVAIGVFVMIPSLGNLGTMQMGFIFALGFYGFSRAEALSFSIAYQFFETVPVILAGIYYFWAEGFSFTRKANNERK